MTLVYTLRSPQLPVALLERLAPGHRRVSRTNNIAFYDAGRISRTGRGPHEIPTTALDPVGKSLVLRESGSFPLFAGMFRRSSSCGGFLARRQSL